MVLRSDVTEKLCDDEVEAVMVLMPVVVNANVVLAVPELAVTLLLPRPVAEKVTVHLFDVLGAIDDPLAALAPRAVKVIDVPVFADAAEPAMVRAVPGGYACAAGTKATDPPSRAAVASAAEIRALVETISIVYRFLPHWPRCS